jgi:hypothetical protein
VGGRPTLYCNLVSGIVNATGHLWRVGLGLGVVNAPDPPLLLRHARPRARCLGAYLGAGASGVDDSITPSLTGGPWCWGEGVMPPRSINYTLKSRTPKIIQAKTKEHEDRRVSPTTEGEHRANEGLGAPSVLTGQNEDHREFRRLSAWDAKTMCCNLLLIVIRGPHIADPCYRVPLVSRYEGRVVSASVHACN